MSQVASSVFDGISRSLDNMSRLPTCHLDKWESSLSLQRCATVLILEVMAGIADSSKWEVGPDHPPN